MTVTVTVFTYALKLESETGKFYFEFAPSCRSLYQTYFSDFQQSCAAKPWLVCTDREVLKLYLVKLLLL